MIGPLKPAKTIAVAGTQEHIGTTTQALQLLQYLQLMGNHACYVEMHHGNYIKNLKESLEVKEKEPGHIEINHVELYEAQHIKKLVRKEYDYLIKDYGNCSELTFNAASYMEQEEKIIVGGIKPNEIFHLYDVLKDPKFDDVTYILSFVDSSQEARDEILQLFDYVDGWKKYIKSNRVFFADYAPEPFEYIGTSNRRFSDLLNREGRK